MAAKFVGGPFDGQVLEDWADGVVLRPGAEFSDPSWAGRYVVSGERESSAAGDPLDVLRWTPPT